MQALYGFRQAEQSDYFLSHDYITDFFAPDLNSPEPQNLAELKQHGQTASSLFTKSFSETVPDLSHETVKIRKAVNEALILYKERVKKDTKHYRRQMLEEIDRIYEAYILVLILLIRVIDYSEEDEEEEKNKLLKQAEKPLYDYSKLRKNPFLLVLKNNVELESLRAKKNLHWETGKVRKLFRSHLKNNPTILEYLKSDPDEEEDRKILLDIVKNSIFKDKTLQDSFEERDFTWVENQSIVKSLVVKTLKSLVPSGEKVLIDISGNWEEDKVFFEELYDETLAREKELGKLISERARNWDMERIAVTDNILLKMALSEMIAFPSIPVKVSINEYIELSKNYSTPKSKQFINGMLDNLSQELLKKGIIRKSGRGLIDNK